MFGGRLRTFLFLCSATVAALDLSLAGCGDRPSSEGPASDAGSDATYFVRDAADSAPPDSIGRVTQVSAGGSFACALGENGYVWCWGSNQAAELGADEALVSDFGAHATPLRVKALSDVVRISAGYLMACAVKEDGTVWCWGANDFGQLGHAPTEPTCSYDFGTLPCTNDPVQVPGVGDDVEQISASASDVTCVRKSDRSLWCWGANESGALGHEPALDSQTCTFGACTPTPGRIGADADGGAFEVAGFNANATACAVGLDGGAFCWGRNESGELGIGSAGDVAHHLYPVPVVGLTAPVARIGTDVGSCVVQTDGRVACWGDDDEGQLGTYSGATCYSILVCDGAPHLLAGMPPISQVSDGFGFSIALASDGSVWGWGNNAEGELGHESGSDGDTTCQQACHPAPLPIALP